MPRYNALDTEVSLILWEPSRGRPATKENAHYKHINDPWTGQHVEQLKEEYFDKPGGIDFLGPSSFPFYLINAGQNLFVDSGPTPVGDTTGSLGKLPRASTPQPTTEILDEDTDSPLSDPPSTVTSSMSLGGPINTDTPKKEDSVKVTPRKKGSGKDSDENDPKTPMSEPKGWLARHPVTPASCGGKYISKPITKVIPIKVQLDLDRESFIMSLIDQKHSDLCVNIFYNGQLTHSRVLGYQTVRPSGADGKQISFSGRRVGCSIEVPFVLLPLSEVDQNSSGNGLHFQERWNRTNRLLQKEAEKWGRSGKYGMFRSPVGEYLEELSRLCVPDCIKGEKGNHAGIIDVVIAEGRSLVVNKISADCPKPERKLPEAFIGKEKIRHFMPEEKPAEKGRRANASNLRSFTPKLKNSRGNIRKRRGYGDSGDSDKDLPDEEEDAEPAIRHVMGDLARMVQASERMRESQAAVQDLGGPFSSRPLARMPTRSRTTRTTSATFAPSPLRDSIQSAASSQVTNHRQNSSMRKDMAGKTYTGILPSQPDEAAKLDLFSFPRFDANLPPAASTRSHKPSIFQKKNSQTPNVQQPNFGHLRYSKLRGDDEEEGAIGEPGSPTPLTRSPRVTSRGSFNTRSKPQEIAPAFGMDGADDIDNRRTTRSGTTFAKTPDTVGSRAAKVGPSPTIPGSAGQLKRKRTAATPNDESPPKMIRLNPEADTKTTLNPTSNNTQTHSEQATSGVIATSTQRKLRVGGSTSGLAANSTTQSPVGISGPKRAPRNSVSNRELGALLAPHKPTQAVDSSFGQSFAATSTARTSRRRSRANSEVGSLNGKDEPLKIETPMPGVSVRHENKNLTIFYGPKIKEYLGSKLAECLLQIKPKKAVVRRDTRSRTMAQQNSGDTSATSGLTQQAGLKTEEILSAPIPSLRLPMSSAGESGVPSVQSGNEDRSSSVSHLRLSLPPARETQAASTELGNQDTSVPVLRLSMTPSKDSQPASIELEHQSPSVPVLRLSMPSTIEARSTSVDHGRNPPRMSGPATIRDLKKQYPNPVKVANPSRRISDQFAPLANPGLTFSNQLAASRMSGARSYSQTSEGHKTPLPRADAPAPYPRMDTPATSIRTRSSDSKKGEMLPPPLFAPPAIPRSFMEPQSRPNRKRKESFDNLNSSSTSKPATPLDGLNTINVKPTPSSKDTAKPTPGSSARSALKYVFPSPPVPIDYATVNSDMDDFVPVDLCQDSVLTYGTQQNTSGWTGVQADLNSDLVIRNCRQEREAIFRSYGILMGVRYVVGVCTDVKSTVAKSTEAKSTDAMWS